MQNIVTEAEANARKMYSKWTDSQGSHCNRYPSYNELSDAAREDWMIKANPVRQAPPLKTEELVDAVNDVIGVVARQLYRTWTESQGVPRTQFPAYDDLKPGVRQDWRDKAIRNMKVPKPKEPQVVTEKTAWPTNDEVYAELVRVRKNQVNPLMYISTNAVNDVMSAVRTLACAEMQKDTYVAGMQTVVDQLLKERDAVTTELKNALVQLASTQRQLIDANAEIAALTLGATARTLTDDDIEAICDGYESGYGHGLWNDGLDLSKTPFANPLVGKAYQLGYDKGLEGTEDEPEILAEDEVEVKVSLPENWRLVNTNYDSIFNAIGFSVTPQNGNAISISVQKFLRRLDENQNNAKLFIKKDKDGK